MRSYLQIPHARWLQIAEEYAGGMSGPKLAEKCGLSSTRTISLILQKYRQEQE